MGCVSILIVEDELMIQENLRMLLEMEGYRVFVANNGKEGLTVLQDMPRPCLILLDLLMPVMTGQEFMEAMKGEDALATIPVCIVSGVAEKPKESIAVGFIKKPFEFTALMQIVQKYCGRPSKKEKAG